MELEAGAGEPPSMSSPLPPNPNKGKGKVGGIGVVDSSSYLGAAYKHARLEGPSGEGPGLMRAYKARFGFPPGVEPWCPDSSIFYVEEVKGKVCFFLAAFENGLRFPLHPFIKSVLQHFNVCPSQLSPNFYGVLVGLLVYFIRHNLGIPSLPLLTELFNVKLTSSEGFLYISKRAGAKKIISDLPSSHKQWKKHFFYIGGINWEFNHADKTDTLGIPRGWNEPENLGESLAEVGCVLIWNR